MKILPVDKIREADAYTITNEPISDIELMERAASECFYWCISHITHDRKIFIFCGPGNNGGDGLAIARMMVLKGYNVTVLLTSSEDSLSPDCLKNYQRFKDIPGSDLRIIKKGDVLPKINDNEVVIDALLGSGLARPVKGFLSDVISYINSSKAHVISVDLPSGMYCDETNQEETKSGIVHAGNTLTFSPPKLGLFFQENDTYLGEWTLFDIGIMQEFIDGVAVKNHYLDEQDIKPILRKRNKFSHKGSFGHALLICGSLGKMGAAVMAARAALRSGPGLVTVRAPYKGASIIQTAVPEAMISVDPQKEYLSEIPDLGAYTAIGAGPGISTSGQTAGALKLLIQNAGQPIIFDADAINIISENRTWLGFLPKNCIFTPHPKEFERLAGKSSNQFERNSMQLEFSFKYQSYVVLKGAHTAITTPEGICYFNSTGNPGMATGGSGDVLTGIITGLKAQGYSSLESCLLGVYIHGLAGDLALAEKGYEALIAGDIIDNLGKAFQLLYGKL